MPADYSKRVHRLIRIITLIQGEGGWNIARLAQEFAVTQRTIYRDLEALTAAGVPVQYDAERQTYAIGREFYLPPVQLTLEEALAVISLGESVGAAAQIPHLHQILSAARKLRSQLNPEIRAAIGAAEGRVRIQLAAANSPEQTRSLYEQALRAVRERLVVEADYESPSADDKPKPLGGRFRLKPYELVYDQRAWYVIGHSSRHRAERTFKLGRFTCFKLTKETFELPRGWTLDKYRGYAWRMIKGPQREFIELIFAHTFAETITDTQWHKSQLSEPLKDGSVRMTFEVDGLDEIVWWVLSMGPHCRVVKPAELAHRVTELAAGICQLYAAKPSSPEMPA